MTATKNLARRPLIDREIEDLADEVAEQLYGKLCDLANKEAVDLFDVDMESEVKSRGDWRAEWSKVVRRVADWLVDAADLC